MTGASPGAGEPVRLRAGDASVTVDPDRGGMLTSLRVAGRELLVQAGDDGGPVPMFGSFLMAPWVAEMAAGRLDFRGRTYPLPRNVGSHATHGLVLRRPWAVVSADDREVILSIELGPTWPFGGVVRQAIRLDADALTLTAEIVAGDLAMPVGLGWHPWFACPDPARVRVTVQADRRLELDDELLPTGNVVPVSGDADLRVGPILGDRRIDVVFVDVSAPAEIDWPEVRLRLESDPAISIVVVYATGAAVCVEPWSAWPDAVAMEERGYPSGVEVIEPGGSFRRWTCWAWSSPGTHL